MSFLKNIQASTFKGTYFLKLSSLNKEVIVEVNDKEIDHTSLMVFSKKPKIAFFQKLRTPIMKCSSSSSEYSMQEYEKKLKDLEGKKVFCSEKGEFVFNETDQSQYYVLQRYTKSEKISKGEQLDLAVGFKSVPLVDSLPEFIKPLRYEMGEMPNPLCQINTAEVVLTFVKRFLDSHDIREVASAYSKSKDGTVFNYYPTDLKKGRLDLNFRSPKGTELSIKFEGLKVITDESIFLEAKIEELFYMVKEKLQPALYMDKEIPSLLLGDVAKEIKSIVRQLDKVESKVKTEDELYRAKVTLDKLIGRIADQMATKE